MSIKILVVEDHGIVRQGTAHLLAHAEGLEVVGEVETGREAIELAKVLSPDVVVMDIGLPDMTGTEAALQIQNHAPSMRLIALSAFKDRQHVLEALRVWAAAYIVKDCLVDELIEAIRTVAAGKRYISPSISNLILSGLSSPTRRESDVLTPRESEVLCLLADGKGTREAANALGVSTKTVETHRRAIMHKLQLFSIAELTKHAVREGYSSL